MSVGCSIVHTVSKTKSAPSNTTTTKLFLKLFWVVYDGKISVKMTSRNEQTVITLSVICS